MAKINWNTKKEWTKYMKNHIYTNYSTNIDLWDTLSNNERCFCWDLWWISNRLQVFVSCHKNFQEQFSFQFASGFWPIHKNQNAKWYYLQSSLLIEYFNGIWTSGQKIHRWAWKNKQFCFSTSEKKLIQFIARIKWNPHLHKYFASLESRRSYGGN